jgi:hypothetical protein
MREPPALQTTQSLNKHGNNFTFTSIWCLTAMSFGCSKKTCIYSAHRCSILLLSVQDTARVPSEIQFYKFRLFPPELHKEFLQGVIHKNDTNNAS